MLEQEILTPLQKREEKILLEIRLSSGIALADLSAGEIERLSEFLGEGFLRRDSWDSGRVVLSNTGRLIADRIVREILL